MKNLISEKELLKLDKIGKINALNDMRDSGTLTVTQKTKLQKRKG
jgi:hypothetical protein